MKEDRAEVKGEMEKGRKEGTRTRSDTVKHRYTHAYDA